jgi:hypothetical protein
MAKTLFDTISKTLQAAPAPQQQQDQTAQVQGLLRAKLGKATTGTGAAPAASNVQEQVANRQTQLQGQQLQQQGVVEAQQLQQQAAGQQGQLAEQQRQLAEQSKSQTQRFNLDSENLLSEFERGLVRLDDNREATKAEQLGFQLRLQDKQYLQALEMSGAKERIRNAQNFAVEIANTEIGMNKALLKLGLDSKAIAEASERQFNEGLGRMGIDEARSLFREEQNHQRRMAPYTAGSAILSAGIGYAASKEKAAPEEEA